VTAVDKGVGRRVRLRRQIMGLTQVKLAEQVGVSFQQLQKYESGVNRIGASRLEQIARALGVPPAHFFGDTTEGARLNLGPTLDRFMDLPESADLIAAFAAIEQRRVRRQVVNVVRAIQAACAEADDLVRLEPSGPAD
jgi:transcriptional regulator with XRE-family HTH domain